MKETRTGLSILFFFEFRNPTWYCWYRGYGKTKTMARANLGFIWVAFHQPDPLLKSKWPSRRDHRRCWQMATFLNFSLSHLSLSLPLLTKLSYISILWDLCYVDSTTFFFFSLFLNLILQLFFLYMSWVPSKLMKRNWFFYLVFLLTYFGFHLISLFIF